MSVADFSPELRLLLAFLRLTLGTDDKPSVPAHGTDWRAFLGLVERHRIGPLLHHRIGAAMAEMCPAEVGRRLQSIARANSLKALESAALQRSLVGTLARADIDVLAIKGLVLSKQLYGSISTRHIGDIDLLIRPTDAVRADTVMQADGWRRTNPDFPLTPLQTRKYLQLKPEFEYIHRTRPFRVELRWRLEGAMDLDAVFNQAISWSLAGTTLRTLPNDVNAVYLFEHGARHAWFRLFWLADIALMMRAPGFDATGVRVAARQLAAERAVWQGAALAENLLGVIRPDALQPSPVATRRVTRLAADARSIIAAEPHELDSFHGWLRQLLYRVRLQEHLRAKMAMVAPHLFSPLGWRMWPLPDRWFFLYYVATPFLWLWRRLRQRE
jgi:hypothetical protein